ncbi:hypothetical protein L6452_32532 [Arctium lappa]|uniref:Uncharacterized protein n=1 Tax=Arctium lappa TaxID=4217 RepID=A0ACB8Z959_ARCLA|nr:hypothetical protein L6452_32532 [Arctium lappa]
MSIYYRSDISGIEAERNDLKLKNSEYLKMIQELQLKLFNCIKTPECINCTKNSSNFAGILYEKEKEIKEKEREIMNLQSQLKTTEQKSSEPQAESVELQNELKAFKEKTKGLESENFELKKNLSDLEKQLVANKAEFESEKKFFSKNFSDFSKKCYEEKKSLELKGLKLSQQISDFEKVLILEREKFDKEKKAIEKKNVRFFKELSGQRTESEKGFEEERSIFESEIKKLTSKLSELSAVALNEQSTKSEFTTKIDQLVKERDTFVSKIKELEKSVSSSNQKFVSSQRSVKSFNQIRRTNLFYDEFLDGSDTYPKKSFKKEKLVWQKKPVKDDKENELKEKKSCVLIQKAKKNKAPNGKKFYCSIFCTHDHFHKTNDHFWYGSYSVSPTRTTINISGPKYQWVPKSKPESVLQAPHSKGE